MEMRSLRLSQRPAYTREESQAAWRAFVRAPHGTVLLDLLLHQAFLVQPEDLRGLGKQDLMLWMIANIQEAETDYGRASTAGDEQPPAGAEWWFPQPGR